MAKINWTRHRYTSTLERNYWNDPKNGFDKAWHQQRSGKRQINLGEHEHHNWQPIRLNEGPHAGKIICNTCKGKWIAWLPKGA